MQAVKALHDQSISHTDLKPGNVVVSLLKPDGGKALEAAVTDLGGAVVNNQCKFMLMLHERMVPLAASLHFITSVDASTWSYC